MSNTIIIFRSTFSIQNQRTILYYYTILYNTMKSQDYFAGKKNEIPELPPDTATPAGDDPRGIALRDRAIAKNDPLGGIFGAGKSAMDVAEMFGVDRKTVGSMILKSVLSGKLELPGVKSETVKRKKLEVIVDQLIKMIWTIFGIFMIFQVFVFITTMVII